MRRTLVTILLVLFSALATFLVCSVFIKKSGPIQEVSSEKIRDYEETIESLTEELRQKEIRLDSLSNDIDSLNISLSLLKDKYDEEIQNMLNPSSTSRDSITKFIERSIEDFYDRQAK